MCEYWALERVNFSSHTHLTHKTCLLGLIDLAVIEPLCDLGQELVGLHIIKVDRERCLGQSLLNSLRSQAVGQLVLLPTTDRLHHKAAR
jgi:hypothetical protein